MRPAPAPPPVRGGPRDRVERRSAVLLVYLSQRPRLLLPLVSAALLLGGLALPPAYGIPLLLVLLLIVAWLSYLSWPVVSGGARVVRLLLPAVVIAAVVVRLLG